VYIVESKESTSDLEEDTETTVTIEEETSSSSKEKTGIATSNVFESTDFQVPSDTKEGSSWGNFILSIY
jgi:hypothetical protein